MSGPWEFRVACECGWTGPKAEFARHECHHQSIPSPFDDPGLIALVACLVAILVIAAMVKS